MRNDVVPPKRDPEEEPQCRYGMIEKGRLRTVLSDAVWAAYRRTLELGERLEEETAGS